MYAANMSEHVEQLLGRETTKGFDRAARDLIAGRRVLITGAGGSIGSELVRQVAGLDPAQLFLLDHDESHLHSIQLEMFADGQLDHERTVLADIRDGGRLARLFEELRPDVVYHAAAHKHLSILERYPSEAIRTNTLGTQNVIDACLAGGTSRLILVSTDKAADPTSVLGASKHLAEVLIRQAASPTLRTASVRFGNVLGSRGSFLHTLAHQMGRDLPVTVTHPRVERYFMSIPEAAGLVVEASVMAQQGEVYVLDMGTPVRILDLIRRFAEAQDAPMPRIKVTGLREGEKLSEELTSGAEAWEPTATAKISRVLAESAFLAQVEANDHTLGELFVAASRYDEAGVRRELAACGYHLTATASTQGRSTGTVVVPSQRSATHVARETAS